MTQFPDYDGAYNATVSKNVAHGLGYVTSYDQYYFNNYEITTGPTILLPTALLIKIFGNVHWVGAVNTLIIFSLLVLLIVIEKRISKKSWSTILTKFAIFLMILFILVPPLFFTKVYGEIPATLFFIIASVIYFSKSQYRYAIAGIFFGMAFVTKTVMLLLFLPIFFHALLRIFKQNNYRYKELKFFSTMLISFVLTIAISSIILNLLNPMSFPSKPGGTHFFLKNSGILTLLESNEKVVTLLNNVDKAMNALLYDYGKLTIVLLLLLLLILVCAIFKKRKADDSSLIAYRYLLICLLPFSIWWFYINGVGWVRHFMPVMIIVCYVTASYFSIGDLKTKYFERLKSKVDLRLVFIVILTIIASRFIPIYYQNYFSYAIKLQDIERIEQLYSAKAALEEIKEQDQNAIFLGCGDWYVARDIEYLLDSTLNFVKCERYFDSIPLGKAMYLVRNEHYLFLADRKEEYEEFTKKCDENIVFDEGVYKISKCS